ncbi:MAG: NADH-quinone oxidoreductase subunit L [Acidimicrobiia bacterium]|nr:NADH-quinone oxidoreductase subunit L [Acidimicrobiia bacterium]
MVNVSLPLVLAATDGAELSSGGFFAATAWIMLVLPFVAFLAIILVGKRLKGLGAELAIGAMGINLVWASVLLVQNMLDGIYRGVGLTIAEIGTLGLTDQNLSFELGFVVDGLSIMMYWVVAFVGFLVFLYAHGYMKGDVRVPWFFASLSLFAGSMLVLVGAPNLIQLIIGWEGVGLASYLLIGHYWEHKPNSDAAVKAFMTNKVADVGLILGTILIGPSLGSFRFSALNQAAADHSESLEGVAVVGGLLLFFGAMGKSAQFPLHVWLPDAMAGPTPVSALMHAATMVTAGIYLMARTFPLYQEMATDARAIMLPIAVITLFVLGFLALVADDLKRVLAFSTVSQLGYMMAAVAAGGYTAGLFHLFTHAFFKALLFLGAGSVIHAVHSNNMSDMGGLRKSMPVTFWTFVVGAVSLAGVIPLAGFWSKDEILATLGHEGYTLFMWVAILGAFVTAFYMTRAVSLTFLGTYKGTGHPHESPPVMTGPLVALAIPSVVAGLFNIPGVTWGPIGNFTEWVGHRVVPMGDYHPKSIEWDLAAYGLIAAGAGILLGWRLFAPDAATQTARDRLRIPVLYPLLHKGYYIDDLYMKGVVNPIKGPVARAVDWVNAYVIDTVINGVGALTARIGELVYGRFDQQGIDLVLNATAGGTGWAGGRLRLLQSGKVRQYAAGFVVGALLLVIALVIVI